MRNENEKKSVTKSVKMSSQQEQQIREQAKKKGMKFSEYMLTVLYIAIMVLHHIWL